jgi:hypothetical protein
LERGLKLPLWRKAVYGAQVVGLAALLIAGGFSGGSKSGIASSTDAVIVADPGTTANSPADSGFDASLPIEGEFTDVSATLPPVSDPSEAPASGDGITPPISAVASPNVSVAPVGGSATGKVEVLYKGALAPGWEDMGYAKKRTVGAGPAVIDMGEWQGWILGRPGKPFTAESVEFAYKTDRKLGTFLVVTTANADVGEMTEMPAKATAKPGEWQTVTIAIAQMNRKNQPVDRIRIRPSRRVASPTMITIDNVRLIGSTSAPAAVATSTEAPVAVNTNDGVNVKQQAAAKQPGGMSIDCRSNVHKISPLIYGIGWSGASYLTDQPWGLGATVNRWGGNPTSRYNWEQGNVWNTGADFFFRNVDIAGTPNASETFLSLNGVNGLQSVITVPMLGWVAKDNSSYSFPAKKFGAQKEIDPSNGDAGNGILKNGNKPKPLDPSVTSIESTPEWVGRWVQKLRGRTTMYILDNEPDLWNSTHRDVHPKGLSYDELLDKTIRYGTAVRANDPSALIAGPAFSGWFGYSFSGVDAESGDYSPNAPDRKAHGKIPILQWYLQQVRAYESKNKVKLLDVLDVHFYPQGERVYAGDGVGGTDPATNARRIRQVRGLWDPSYKDESWIDEKIQLLPRMKTLINENAPGLKLSIGEWNFGGEGHMSGGIATAEALGQFGVHDLHSAFYWTSPPVNSPSFYAFRAFRDYDGKGAKFLDNSVSATRDGDLSMFASTNDAATEMTVVLINANPSKSIAKQVNLANCKSLASVQTFSYAGNPKGFSASKVQNGSGSAFAMKVAPYSINVVRLKLKG